MLFILLLLTHCGRDFATTTAVPAPAPSTSGEGALDAKLSWYDGNRERLDEMIATYGLDSDTYDAEHLPIAIFDWDNTIIKNDIGDATLYWMLAHNLIYQPADRNWAESELLSADAVTALKTACDVQGEPGAALITDRRSAQSRACADEIITIYFDEKTTSGVAAFDTTKINSSHLEPAYAWAVQLQAGHTVAEMKTIARDAFSAGLAASVGATQTIGNRDGFPAYLRIYDQMKDLITVLQEHGFDVWIVSASAQPLIEEVAREVKVPADHVIGVQAMTSDDGKLLPTFVGCGTYPNGNQGVMTYKDGKRCFINKVILDEADTGAMLTKSAPICFAAGDSDTDISFMKDAQCLRLAINRNKPELMCNAYENADGNWLINPMFIEPKPQKPDPYVCGEYGIADQVDSVF